MFDLDSRYLLGLNEATAAAIYCFSNDFKSPKYA